MTPGTRVKVTGSVWPERVGCLGVIATPPSGTPRYPWAGLGRDEVVVLLDDDPLDPLHRHTDRAWSCVMGADQVEVLG